MVNYYFCPGISSHPFAMEFFDRACILKRRDDEVGAYFIHFKSLSARIKVCPFLLPLTFSCVLKILFYKNKNLTIVYFTEQRMLSITAISRHICWCSTNPIFCPMPSYLPALPMFCLTIAIHSKIGSPIIIDGLFFFIFYLVLSFLLLTPSSWQQNVFSSILQCKLTS